jgi:F-type H+-transporting ATPase subunit b
LRSNKPEAEALQIDWLTVAAQIVNFLILIGLLKKFLYQPILRAMELRQKNMADKLGEAEEMHRNAERSAEQYRIRQQELEDQRSGLLEVAKREVENQRARMIDQLREEVNQKRLAWYTDFAQEKLSASEDIKAMLGDKIMRLSRRALADLADADLERQIIRRFLGQLADMPDAEHRNLAEALSREGWVEVLSHFELHADDLRLIEERLSGLHPGLRIDFVKSAQLICGIVLETGGYSWSWSFDRYLEEFEELLAARDLPEKSKGLA